MAVDFNDEGYPIDENGDLVPPNGGDEKGSFWVLSDGSCLSRYPNGYWERTTTKLVGMTLVDNTMELKAPSSRSDSKWELPSSGALIRHLH